MDRCRDGAGGWSTTRGHSGLGLGLAIVKNLVEMHGGSVRAKSPGTGQGATFTVHLPMTIVHRRDAGDGDPERSHPRTHRAGEYERAMALLVGLKVLVVDDEPDARHLIHRVLTDCGAQVSSVGSAADGLLALGSLRPDILISDIGMPEMDGYEFIARVRGMDESAGGRTPAIALTAFARSEDRTRALLAGYLVHVSKPVEPSELIAIVASITGRTGAASRADN